MTHPNGHIVKNWGLAIVLVLGISLWIGTITYIWWQNRQDAEHEVTRVEMISRQFAYRACLDRNELRSKLELLYAAALELPPRSDLTKEGREKYGAFHALLRTELASLRPRD